MNYKDPKLQEQLAAEYVLGNLHGQARRRFEHLLQADPHLQAVVASWSQRLDVLNDQLPPVTPPARVWSEIEQKIPQNNDNPWRNVVFWRRFGAIAASIALLAILIGGFYLEKPDTPQHVVFVTNNKAQPVWVVKAQAKQRKFRIKTLVPTRMPANKVCVLWLIWDDGKTRPIGVLSDNVGETSLPFPPGIRNTPENAQLAVTVEQADSPLSQPSGEVIFKGPWVRL